jgi:hypothetical protein
MKINRKLRLRFIGKNLGIFVLILSGGGSCISNDVAKTLLQFNPNYLCF